MASSGLNQPADTVSVHASDAILRDIKSISNELKDLKKSIDKINTVPVKIESGKKVTQTHDKDTSLGREQHNKKLSVISISPAIENTNVVAKAAPEYIKHDENGSVLADDTEKWACVHDTVTDLMWEVKSQGSEFRNANNLYSWYDPARKNMAGQPDGGRCQGGTDCDTNAYIKVINESNYCGHNDWQLPTREQMQTIVDLQSDRDNVTINQQYFPHTVPSWYWTSSDKNNNSDFAWYILFSNGFALSDLKQRPKHIRLVRKSVNGADGG
jgi:hypothetical protein